jgi:hypothetical protein
MFRNFAVGTAHLLLALSVAAQDAKNAKESATVLKEGTELRLRFTQPISTKTAHTDDPVELALMEDLRVDGVTIARAGARATGIISHSKRAGMMGKGAELNVRLEHLMAEHGRVKLRGSRGREGEGKVGTAVALTVLFGPIGLIKKGKEIEIKEGTELKAYVSDDTPVPQTARP